MRRYLTTIIVVALPLVVIVVAGVNVVAVADLGTMVPADAISHNAIQQGREDAYRCFFWLTTPTILGTVSLLVGVSTKCLRARRRAAGVLLVAWAVVFVSGAACLCWGAVDAARDGFPR